MEKLHVNIQGQGQPLVLVHGFCEDSRVWDSLAKELSTHYQIITFDLPGFGQSPALSFRQIESYAEVLENLVARLNLEPFYLIGHSMGGYISLAYAERNPDMLRGLGLFHSHPYPDSPEKRESRLKNAAFVGRNGVPAFVSTLIPGLFAPEYAGAHPDIVQEWIDRAGAYPAEGVINALHAMANRPDRSEVLRHFKPPVLFVIGGQDGVIPANYSMDQTHLPALSDILMLQEAGHMGMLEAAEATREGVLGYLARAREFGG